MSQYDNLYDWAGIGSRQTPSDILLVMKQIGLLLAVRGGMCNTGACVGADQAFAEGAARVDGIVKLALPWPKYELQWRRNLATPPLGAVMVTETVFDERKHYAAFKSVYDFHPNADRLTPGVLKLHARNYLIIEGCKFVICWAPMDAAGKPTGGTGQGCRIAESLGIPVYNLANPDTLKSFLADIESRKSELYEDWYDYSS